ncbi:MAG: protein-glutamate O-methyltransferase CheR, partial [Calditrichaeota bacterium]|nr:protein-glutamate O-methyltransferase CheR [Calditrichota bacterium]
YYDHVVADTSGLALSTLINRISTNHTYFYRESAHFHFFTGELDKIILAQEQSGQRSIRIWSAGCSSGEEAYTLGMILDDVMGAVAHNWELGILATDISENALQKASLAVYPDENVRNLPLNFKFKYLSAQPGKQWKVNRQVQDKVMFRRFNLMNEHFPFKRRFHAIFCRNVMIYFDQQSKDRLLRNFSLYLYNGGKLFLGLSESLGRTNKDFKYVQPGIYEKVTTE